MEIDRLKRQNGLTRVSDHSNIKCYNCQEMGHMARNCPQRVKQMIRALLEELPDGEEGKDEIIEEVADFVEGQE